MEAAVRAFLSEEGTSAAEIRQMVLDTRFSSPQVKGLNDCLMLETLSLSECGITNLVGFPALPRLKVLLLNDNRIVNGLASLQLLESLKELNLANNKISSINELRPLATLQNLKSLDLYKCPIQDAYESSDAYRAAVFKLLPRLVWLDNLDADGVEKPEEDGDEEDEEEDGDDEQGHQGAFLAEGEDDGEDDAEELKEGEYAPVGVAADDGEEEDDEDEDEDDEPGTAALLADNPEDDQDDGWEAGEAEADLQEDDDDEGEEEEEEAAGPPPKRSRQ